MHSGSLKELLKNGDSMTGQYLSGKRSIAVPDIHAARPTGTGG